MISLFVSASLVIYRPELATLERTLFALQAAGRVAKDEFDLKLELTLVDNSDDLALHDQLVPWIDARKAALSAWTVKYIRAAGNVGYGQGNNLVIDSVRSDYHVVVNPDLFMVPDALKEALLFLERHPDTGLLTPAVYGEDGERHYMCKRNPTLFVMFLRSFAPKWLQGYFKSTLAEFEMLDCDYDRLIFDVQYPTGSCMFFRTSVLQAIGGFDPDYFLHYEDADIGRRVLQVARTIYVPSVKVVHQWARDTHRSWSSMLVTIRSGVLYWRKWGGVFSESPSPSATNRPTPDQPRVRQLLGVHPTGDGRLVLVTGANGFIGRAVCADLPLRGYLVRGVVRKKPSPDLPQRVEFISMDTINPDTAWSSSLAGIDSVVHLAARVHLMRETAADPLTEFRRTNVALTLNLARQAASAGVRRFIFISSVKVNGEATPVGQPFSAEDIPHPTDPYAISKYEAEIELLKLASETRMEVVIIRPVLVYGEGVKANFEAMMKWVVKGLPLPLGALYNQRSLVSVDNLVDLIATCLLHPNAANQVFLVSDGDDVTVTELLQRTAGAFGRTAWLVRVPVYLLHAAGLIVGRSAVTRRLCDTLQVDISKNRRLLNWVPPVSVDAALRKAASRLSGN